VSNQQSNEGILQTGGTINAAQLAVGAFATVSGSVNKTINELKTTENSKQTKLGDLLAQLHIAVESDPDLTLIERTEALEQLQKIAKAGSNPSDGAMQKLAKVASRTLKGMLTELPHATKFIEACSSLLPLITKFFGF